MDIDKRHKTLIDLWKSSFIVHNDLVKKDSLLLLNTQREDLKFPIISNQQLYPAMIGADALLLSLFKEKIISKDSNGVNLLINNNIFRQIISKLIIIKNNKAYLGDIEFANEILAFNYLRNKLLHGEYELQANYICIEKDNKISKFLVSQLTDVVLDLQHHMENICNGKNICIIVPDSKYTKLSMKTRLENGLFDYITIKVRKKGELQINDEDLEHINVYIQNLKIIMFREKMSFEDAISYFQNAKYYQVLHHSIDNYFSKNHLEITFEKNSIKQHKNFPLLLKNIINPQNIFYNLDKDNPGEYDIDVLLPLMENILNDNSLIITSKSLRNYILILFHYVLNDGVSIYHYPDQYTQSITFLDDIIIASEFVCFYSKFHYGLDELYSNGRTTNLRDLLKNEKFDFSLLDLKRFNDSKMTVDIKLTSFIEQANKIRTGYRKSYKAFLKVKDQFENGINNNSMNKNSFEKIKTNFLLSKEKYETYQVLNHKLDKFDINKYERYINIINHIRNAFAHGNVSIKQYEYGDTLLDRKICIEDIHHGQVTYKKEICYQDFSLLFNFESNKILQDHIENVTNDENKSNMQIDMQLELDDAYNYIIEEKKGEWKMLINKLRFQKQNNELIYIQLAYCQMEIIKNMENKFNSTEYCQNLITFINYYKQEDRKHSIEVYGSYDEDKINLLECYNRINYYIVNYCKHCPKSMKRAYIADEIPV